MYMRNRYYDPKAGRFTQEDPIGLAGGMNLYGFAGGDPVNFSDPFGLWPCCVEGGVMLAAARDNPMTRAKEHQDQIIGLALGFSGGGLATVEEKEGGALASKVFSKAKQALVDMAKLDKRLGLTIDDMKAYQELNKTLEDPFPADQVRIDPGHEERAPHSAVPHGHVGPVDHIPIKLSNAEPPPNEPRE